MPTVLFTQLNSIYESLNCDCYDVNRNALTFTGQQPVIAHPPCRLFSRMRRFSKAPQAEKQLAYFAVNIIEQNGGILEHPAYSTLWSECQLPLPGNMSNPLFYSISIDQHWFGHTCNKCTWLLISKLPAKLLPVIPLNFDAITHVISQSKRKSGKIEISKNARSATPIRFAQWLIQCLSIIENQTSA